MMRQNILWVKHLMPVVGTKTTFLLILTRAYLSESTNTKILSQNELTDLYGSLLHG